MKEIINVIVIDDHKLYREGIASLLKDYNINASEEACNGRDFFDKLKAKKIKSKIVLLDLEMPELDGDKTLELIKKNHSDLKVIIISQFDEGELIKAFFNKGAHGYVSKGSDAEILAQAIREVNQGKIYRDNLPELFNKAELYSKSKLFKILYSNTERRIIALLCKAKSISEIAQELGVTEKAIQAHLTEIYRKAGVRNKNEFLKYAILEGLNYLGYQKAEGA